MGGSRVPPSVVVALAIIIAIAAAATTTPAAAAVEASVKCGGCSPCGGADCPVVQYPSPPPPALPPPPPYYYYSPPPPATYPYPGGGGCPPPPGAYIQIGSTPPGKGPLYPQDPGFMPASAPAHAAPLTVVAALLACAAWAFL